MILINILRARERHGSPRVPAGGVGSWKNEMVGRKVGEINGEIGKEKERLIYGRIESGIEVDEWFTYGEGRGI